MKIDEVKKLSDEELGRDVAWEAGALIRKSPLGNQIQFRFDYFENGIWKPTALLCTDLNAIAEVEQIVIRERGLQTYGVCLRNVFGYMTDLFRCDLVAEIATADAKTRAQACLLALQTDGNR